MDLGSDTYLQLHNGHQYTLPGNYKYTRMLVPAS